MLAAQGPVGDVEHQQRILREVRGGAHHLADVPHQHRRGEPAARHVADRDRDAAAGEDVRVEPVAADPRFLNNGLRLKHRPELTALLAEIFATHDGQELTIRMLKYGLPAGPVMGVDQAMVAEHTEARGMVVDVGDVRTLGTPIKMSRTPGGPRNRPPRFAEHTDSVLGRHGFSEAEIAALEAQGVLFRVRK